jgi:DNA-directed RNA polymerase subunit K/omega
MSDEEYDDYDDIDIELDLDPFDQEDDPDKIDFENIQDEDEKDYEVEDLEEDLEDLKDIEETLGEEIIAADYFHKIIDSVSPSQDYIASVSAIAKDILVVKPDDRQTRRAITKKEYARIVGIRTKLIALFGKVFTDVTDITDPKVMAIKEIKEKKCPLMVKREIGVNKEGKKICEIWSVNELIIPFD